MRGKKVEFEWFTILEHDKEEKYLRYMHNRGWKFYKVVFPGFYYFTECEPEDVVYQLDYNKDRMDGMGDYIRMFADCGWEFILDFVGYSYFRKRAADMNGEEEIFNDDNSKKEMLLRVYKGRLIPLAIIFGTIICPQLILAGINGRDGIFALYWVLFLLYVIIFAGAAAKYFRYKR